MRSALLAAVLSVFAMFPATAKTSSTVLDCAKGDTFAKALASNADPLVIEFTGTCTENVVIARDHVTIRGAGDAVLQGAAANPAASAIAVVGGARAVSLSDFTIRNSFKHGVEVKDGSSADIRNLHVSGSAGYGLLVFPGRATVADSSFDGNGRDGIGVWGASMLMISGSNSVSGNARSGFSISDGSVLMTDTGSAATIAITADDNGYSAIFVQESSTARFASTLFRGSGNGGDGIAIWDHSLLTGREFDIAQSGAAHDLGNGGAGLWLTTGSRFVCNVSCSFTDNWLSGIYIDSDSSVTAPAEVSGNGFGIFVHRSTASFANLATNDGVRLEFGTRAEFSGATSVPNLSCDGSVLVSGATCPGMAAAAMSRGRAKASPAAGGHAHHLER